MQNIISSLLDKVLLDRNQANIVSNFFLLFLFMLSKEAIKCLNAAIDIYTDMVR